MRPMTTLIAIKIITMNIKSHITVYISEMKNVIQPFVVCNMGIFKVFQEDVWFSQK